MYIQAGLDADHRQLLNRWRPHTSTDKKSRGLVQGCGHVASHASRPALLVFRWKAKLSAAGASFGSLAGHRLERSDRSHLIGGISTDPSAISGLLARAKEDEDACTATWRRPSRGRQRGTWSPTTKQGCAMRAGPIRRFFFAPARKACLGQGPRERAFSSPFSFVLRTWPWLSPLLRPSGWTLPESCYPSTSPFRQLEPASQLSSPSGQDRSRLGSKPKNQKESKTKEVVPAPFSLGPPTRAISLGTTRCDLSIAIVLHPLARPSASHTCSASFLVAPIPPSPVEVSSD
ncbi:uncharacterized protein PSFLO_01450 [Pseudozyma flocculosa]|uniref:Uncharacterized protein n=1 Tax=Pseudozyma flocculosa TaxID=84751 RepID=A0A5C3EXX8_9BASI|nr:uncharacterized protein PSFLO_01450 [Pseudozyma flocculosa]